MNDRRRSKRIEAPEAVVGTVKSSLPARILDLSAHGIQVEMNKPLRPQVDCNIAVPVATGPLVVRARVERCRASILQQSEAGEGVMVYRAGLSFVDLSEQSRELIEETILDFALAESPSASGDAERRLKIQIHVDDSED